MLNIIFIVIGILLIVWCCTGNFEGPWSND
jgi:hypothetical protein